MRCLGRWFTSGSTVGIWMGKLAWGLRDLIQGSPMQNVSLPLGLYLWPSGCKAPRKTPFLQAHFLCGPFPLCF